MDVELFDTIHEELVPKFNPIIANGIVCEQMKEVEHYIDRVWRCAAASFPKDLEYLGCERCTPKEQYARITRKRGNKIEFDISQSDFYLVKYHFAYQGKRLDPRYMFLPFVDRGGIITVRGSKFAVSPVMADPFLSVEGDTLFMPLTRDRVTFERITHNFLTNKQRQSVSVVTSFIHHKSQAATRKKQVAYDGKKVSVQPALAHYLFCKFGVTETFKRYCNTDVHIGDGEYDINHDKYPEDQWVICESTGLKPFTVKDRYYRPTSVRLAIRKEDYTVVSEPIIAGLFYLLDHFPDRCVSEWLDHTRLWRVLLGHVIFKSDASEGRLVEDIQAHLTSLDDYIDNIVAEQAQSEGIPCGDIYELFVHIMETMVVRIVNADVTNLYGKHLTILRYILLDVIRAINNFTFKLGTNVKKTMTDKDIVNIMNKVLRPDAIRSINDGHGEVTSVNNAGDNMLFKITAKVVPQTDATRSNKHEGNSTASSRFLHASLAEVCSFGNQPKYCPTGHGRLNPYLQIGVSGEIRQNPEFKDVLDDVQARIVRT